MNVKQHNYPLNDEQFDAIFGKGAAKRNKEINIRLEEKRAKLEEAHKAEEWLDELFNPEAEREYVNPYEGMELLMEDTFGYRNIW